MSRVRFYLKNNPEKRKSIVAHIFLDTKNPRLYYFTREQIEPAQWDREKQRAKVRGANKAPEASALNSYLDALEKDIKRMILEVKAIDPRASYQTIKAAFDKKFKDIIEKTLLDYYQDFLNIERNNISENTHKAHTAFYRHLKNFEDLNNTPLSFAKIDLFFWEKFYSYLTESEKLRASSCKQYLKILKAFMNWAFIRDIHSNLNFKKFTLSVPTKEILYLEPEELQKLIDLELNDSPALDQARDLFLFGCFTGARYSDITAINREDIKGKVWNLRTRKTRDILSIPLNDIAFQILVKYQDSPRPLPLLTIQKAISGIKEVCKLAEITTPVKVSKYIGNQRTDETHPKYKLIGTHTARRTFVTLSILAGMKPETVMKITGHSDYKTMQKYLNITNKEAHKEYLKIWGDPNLTLVQNQ